MPGRPFPVGPYNPGSGPRLPERLKDIAECWRCTDTRRILRVYRIYDDRHLLGVVRLCGDCAGSSIRLDPDPLTLPESA